MTDLPAWKVYERLVAAMEAEYNGLNYSITPNARVMGKLSGTKRQIDVLIDHRWSAHKNRRVIVDAKARKRPVDVKDVESFEGMMRDCGASAGTIVCTNGFTKAAARRAQELITIKILPIEEADEYDWATTDDCLSCDDGLVIWDGQLPIIIDQIIAVTWTGKCDCCHKFHVWCWACGETFVVPDDDAHKCRCELLWAAVPDPDASMKRAAMLLLLFHSGMAQILDRRPVV